MLGLHLQQIDTLEGLRRMVVEDKGAIPFFAVDFVKTIDAAKQTMIAMVGEEFRFLLAHAADRGKIQGIPEGIRLATVAAKTVHWKTAPR
jgi:hypothetical protein